MLCTLPPDRTTKLDGLFGSLSVSAVPEAQTDLMLSACLLATAFLRSHIARWHGGPCVEAKGCTQTGQGDETALLLKDLLFELEHAR